MLTLPERRGPRPATSPGIPHRQLDQTPPAALHERLLQRLLAIAGTAHGDSLVSVPGARALFLPPESNGNDRYGFIRGHEFAHLHPPSDGSLHVVLAPDDAAQVLRCGWGELHPWAVTGRILPTVTMVYAPRDEREMEVVLEIVAASHANARSVPSATARSI